MKKIGEFKFIHPDGSAEKTPIWGCAKYNRSIFTVKLRVRPTVKEISSPIFQKLSRKAYLINKKCDKKKWWITRRYNDYHRSSISYTYYINFNLKIIDRDFIRDFLKSLDNLKKCGYSTTGKKYDIRFNITPDKIEDVFSYDLIKNLKR